MTVTIEEFYHFCTNPEKCGEVAEQRDGCALMRKYVLKHDGLIVGHRMYDTREAARQAAERKGFEVQ